MYVCSLGRNKTETKEGALFGAFNQTLIIFENSTSIFVFTQFILSFFIHYIYVVFSGFGAFIHESVVHSKIHGPKFLKRT